MDVEEIRNAFSKAGIAITDKGILILYTFKDGGISQSIFDDSHEVFKKLLKLSDKLTISCEVGKIIKLVFRYDMGNQSPVFYSPVTGEVSLRELQSIMENAIMNSDDNGFFEFFDGVNMDDKDEVLGKVRELLSRELELHQNDSLNLSKMVKWKKIRELATEFAEEFNSDCEELEPDYEFDGSVTIPVLYGNQQCVEIAGNSKALFEEILENCSGTDFECSVNEGNFLLTLYA